MYLIELDAQRYARFARLNKEAEEMCLNQGVFHCVELYPKSRICKRCGDARCPRKHDSKKQCKNFDIKIPFYQRSCVKCDKRKELCPQYNGSNQVCFGTWSEALKTIKGNDWHELFNSVQKKFYECKDICENRLEKKKNKINKEIQLIEREMEQIDMELRNEEMGMIAQKTWQAPTSTAELSKLIEDFDSMHRRVKDMGLDDVYEQKSADLKLKKQELQEELARYNEKYHCRLETNEIRFVTWKWKWEELMQKWLKAQNKY